MRRTRCRARSARLLAVSENYPDLKSNANFLALQSQLEGTENRIAVARRDYIAAVQAYNTEFAHLPRRALGLDALFRANKPMAEFTATTSGLAKARRRKVEILAWKRAFRGSRCLSRAGRPAAPALARGADFPALTGRVVDQAIRAVAGRRARR